MKSLKNAIAVFAHLQESGFIVSQRTIYNHIEQGLLKRSSSGEFSSADVDRYAESNLDTADGGDIDTYKERLAAARAAMAEIELAKMKGELLDAAAEEARDAALLLELRRDEERWGGELWQKLIDYFEPIIEPDAIAQLQQRQAEFKEFYLDAVADRFDAFATDHE